MKQFWDDIIEYLAKNLNDDDSYEKEVKVDYSDKQKVKITTPHIFVQPMQDTDAEQYDSFTEGENISFCSVQISPYCQQLRINGELKSAQEASMIFADKISHLFDKPTALKWNKNIVRLRRIGEGFGMPVNDGATTYTSPLRYEFYIQRNYEKIN